MDNFYGFEERMIQTDLQGRLANLSSSARELVVLGYNLYKNYPCDTVVGIFRNLDEVNSKLALEAIGVRFGIDLLKRGSLIIE